MQEVTLRGKKGYCLPNPNKAIKFDHLFAYQIESWMLIYMTRVQMGLDGRNKLKKNAKMQVIYFALYSFLCNTNIKPRK